MSAISPPAAAGQRAGGRARPAIRPRALPIEGIRLLAGLGLIVGLVGRLVTVGADSRWLAALGASIVRRGAVPRGIPFAAAPSGHWANALVLAELSFHGLVAALGDRGLALAQLGCVAVALAVLALDARAARLAEEPPALASGPILTVLAIVSAGALPALAIARVQMFSLLALPLLLMLLRNDVRRPGRRVWLSLALLALWSNLHGGVLAGALVIELFALLHAARHGRRGTAALLALGAPVALCLTPAGVRTIDYYHGLLTNLAVQRGAGQWGPLLSSPYDWVTLAAVVLLAVRIARRPRPPVWELALIGVLALLTVEAARDAVWLLFVMAGPAARSHTNRPGPSRSWTGLVPLAAVVAAILLALDLVAPPPTGGLPQSTIRAAIRLSGHGAILAGAIPAEQVAQAGGRIWAGNPIDAFSHGTQAAYLDWVGGGGAAARLLADPGIEVVIASRGGPQAAAVERSPRFILAARLGSTLLFRRR
jgi:hypothetical protein